MSAFGVSGLGCIKETS